MSQITVSVITPNREFQYTTSIAPRIGEDICIDYNIYTVYNIAHMIGEYSGELNYLLIRAE